MLNITKAYNSWEELILWCSANFQGKDLGTVIKKLAFCSFIYHIWQERNARLYSNRSKEVQSTLHSIIYGVRIKLINKKNQINDSVANRSLMQNWNINATFMQKVPSFYSWSPPVQDSYMINTDGSFQVTASGHGAIIRNKEGRVIVLASGSSRAASVVHAELKGIQMGMLLALNHHIGKVCINTDSLVAVNLIARSMVVPWHLRHIIHSIKNYTREFQSCQFGHIMRETNRAADFLSKLLPDSESFELDPNHLDPDLNVIIQEDAKGVKYKRM